MKNKRLIYQNLDNEKPLIQVSKKSPEVLFKNELPIITQEIEELENLGIIMKNSKKLEYDQISSIIFGVKEGEDVYDTLENNGVIINYDPSYADKRQAIEKIIKRLTKKNEIEALHNTVVKEIMDDVDAKRAQLNTMKGKSREEFLKNVNLYLEDLPQMIFFRKKIFELKIKWDGNKELLEGLGYYEKLFYTLLEPFYKGKGIEFAKKLNGRLNEEPKGENAEAAEAYDEDGYPIY